jgi:MoaA/NifB/PqqE/SkfB family radical SAM enzyme
VDLETADLPRHHAQAEDSEAKRAALRFLSFELTRRCNLRCQHCYLSAHSGLPLAEEMLVDDWMSLLVEARTLGCRSLQLIGGEVTLVPYLEELVTFGSEIGFSQIEVFTNATLVDDALVDTLAAGNGTLATSVYSCDCSIHDGITKKQGSWRRTIAGLEKAIVKGIATRVGIIVQQSNEATLEETVAFLERLGVGRIGIDRVREIGRASASVEAGGGNLRELCGQCGLDQLCVTASGRVLPCPMARIHAVGNVGAAQRLEEILGSPSMEGFRIALFDAKAASGPPAALGPCNPSCWPHAGCAPGCLPAGCEPVGCEPAHCAPRCFPRK